jgi:hypothetical protein
MAASILASFVSFSGIGLCTMFIIADSKLPVPNIIKVCIFAGILFNAFYFFYFEAYAELNKEINEKLKGAKSIEWYIRIINQTILFSLWFLLEINVIAFFAGLISLYISYLIWDCLTYSHIGNKKLLIVDIVGFVITSIMIVVTNFGINLKIDSKSDIMDSSQITLYFIWGMFAIIYLIPPILGLTFTNCEMFDKKYRIRKNRI